MREHQKYFAVISKDKICSLFCSGQHTPVKDMDPGGQRHERVLRARLEDARFFYKSDLDESMETRVKNFEAFCFKPSWEAVYEKVSRLVRLVEFLSQATDRDALFRKQIGRAAWLCKADLVSQVVGEFPKLQGIMGRVYAQAGGEPQDVALAVGEHYQPTIQAGPCPNPLPAPCWP
jgi:glycyl-tRNA synthetase beta chain